MQTSPEYSVLLLAQPQRGSGHGVSSALRHLSALGLFWLAILDSSPLPTFGGPDILTAILAATHRNLWYEYAVTATAGSVIGAYITFRIARRAGHAFLQRWFSQKALKLLDFFHNWGTSALVVSTAVPFPFPTSLFFAAAGVFNYPVKKFLTVTAAARGVRYAAIALIADYYGRHFVRILRHPGGYWVSLLLLGLLIFGLSAGTVLIHRRTRALSQAQIPERAPTTPGATAIRPPRSP